LNPSAVLLAGALNSEVNHGRQRELIDEHLWSIRRLAAREKDAQRLVTAGVTPTLIILLKARALDGEGLDLVLLTLGILA